MASPEMPIETTDLSPRVLGWFAVSLAALVVLVGLAAWGTIATLKSGTGEMAARSGVPDITAPSPALQVVPRRDLAVDRAADRMILDRYGWVDRKAGTVRIPIERAMDLVAERGLPKNPKP